MVDRKKVLHGLECCCSMTGNACRQCPYDEECAKMIGSGSAHLCADALELLKEQPEIVRCKDCKDYKTIHCTCNYIDDLCDDVLKLLKEQPQWISVKDKLPDDASDVLAYYDDGTESRIIPVNYYKGCWYDCVFNRAIDGLETGFIKYWMSLPKAPEVKQNETD